MMTDKELDEFEARRNEDDVYDLVSEIRRLNRELRIANERAGVASRVCDDKTKLRPPDGFNSWLEYAIDSMDTRTLYLQHCIAEDDYWPSITQREDFVNAAREELLALVWQIK